MTLTSSASQNIHAENYLNEYAIEASFYEFLDDYIHVGDNKEINVLVMFSQVTIAEFKYVQQIRNVDGLTLTNKLHYQ